MLGPCGSSKCFSSTTAAPASPSQALRIGLWIAQALVFLLFSAAGLTKLLTPIPTLAGYLLKPVRRSTLLRQLTAKDNQSIEEAVGDLRRLALAGKSQKSLKVLLAEDNPVSALLARTMLEKAGHRVLTDAMKFVDHSEVELERLKAERAAERKRLSNP